MTEYGKYCGESPHTKREQLPGNREGLTISGIECEYRRMTSFGWQSFCSRADRIAMGCERAYLEDL